MFSEDHKAVQILNCDINIEAIPTSNPPDSCMSTGNAL